MPLALALRSQCLRPNGSQLETVVLRLRNSPQVFTQLCSSALCPAPRDLRLAWQGAKKQEEAAARGRPHQGDRLQPPVRGEESRGSWSLPWLWFWCQGRVSPSASCPSPHPIPLSPQESRDPRTLPLICLFSVFP